MLSKLLTRITGYIYFLVNSNIPSIYELGIWSKQNFSAPSPHKIKVAIIKRFLKSDGTFVETGTYKGDTSFAISLTGIKVITIEPDIELFTKAQMRFCGHQNITVLNGTSEEIFPTLIPTLTKQIIFWLDGHFSGVGTFKAELETPIRNELQIIENCLDNFSSITILIDDFRCFGSSNIEFKHYPTKLFLVNWAESNKFNWTIEHDIFIMANYEL